MTPDYDDQKCVRPPYGWECTRGNGHLGPCAAHPAASSLSVEAESGATDEVTERAARAAGIAFGLTCHGPNVSDALRADWDRYRPTEVMRAVARAVLAAAQPAPESETPKLSVEPGTRCDQCNVPVRAIDYDGGHFRNEPCGHSGAHVTTQPTAIRVSRGVVALYRPGPVRNPWHCYNTYDGSFIECRADEDVANYRKLPAAQPTDEERDYEAADVLDGLIAALARRSVRCYGDYQRALNEAIALVEAARQRLGGEQ